MMTQQQKLSYALLASTALLCLLAGVYFFTQKRSSKPDPTDKIIKHSVDTPADEVLKYWTADKMSGAKPAPLPKVHEVERKKQRPHQA